MTRLTIQTVQLGNTALSGRGWLLLLCVLFPQSAIACNIPVFRYALERWTADLFEVDVFFEGPLTAAQREIVSQLEDQSQINGGLVNWEVMLCPLDSPLEPDLQAVAKTLTSTSSPQVVIRRPGGRRGSAIIWSGALSDVNSSLWTSAARTELVRRLTAGDSVVWLVFPGNDAEKTADIESKLESQLPQLAEEIPLPVGVGLPGSELLTRIPLEIRFSVLVVKPDSPGEQIFRAIVSKGVANSEDESQPLLVPVFGRGRAMTAMTADTIDDAVLAECSGFLCGACSCQVKQANPGFDLLLAVNWEAQLTGEADTVIPAPAIDRPTENVSADFEPELVTIPPGKSIQVTSSRSATETSSKTASQRADRRFVWWLVGAMALCMGLIVGRTGFGIRV